MASKNGLPGADELFVSQFTRLFQAGQFKEAAKVAADSATRAAQAAADKTELLNALKDTHYTSCTNTDSVRNIYKRKLQAQ